MTRMVQPFLCLPDGMLTPIGKEGRNQGRRVGVHMPPTRRPWVADDEVPATQISESPDRGLDAQTPSGHEAERAELRPASDQDTAPAKPRL